MHFMTESIRRQREAWKMRYVLGEVSVTLTIGEDTQKPMEEGVEKRRN